MPNTVTQDLSPLMLHRGAQLVLQVHIPVIKVLFPGIIHILDLVWEIIQSCETILKKVLIEHLRRLVLVVRQVTRGAGLPQVLNLLLNLLLLTILI
jgi:hypothetical protein